MEIYKIAKDRVTEIEARKTDATSDLEQLQKDRVSKTLSGVSMDQRMKYIERSLNVLYSSGSKRSAKVRGVFAHLQEALRDGNTQEKQKAENLINQMYLRYYMNERGEKSEAK
ncbi:MAG: hypothetical protein D4S01_00190 [Dehalococcoidia bacterium]|nr:MAG: hypothetical protein D4S01_00190 [Dehalococcoidia bacterium]